MMPKPVVYVNGRFLSQPAAGVHRFALASLLTLYSILGDRLVVLVPRGCSKLNTVTDLPCTVREVWGGKGHFWEQISLPLYLYSRGQGFLFCFCGLPPLMYRQNVYTIHDMAVFAIPETFTKLYSYFYRFMLKFAVLRLSAITVVSEFTRGEVLKYLGVSAPFITSNVVVPRDRADDEQDVLAKYGLHSRTFALCVGTIELRKNLGILHQAALSHGWPDLVLAIVGGSGDAFAATGINTKNFSNLRYLGYISDSDLHTLYSNAAVFIYPSIYEGFGIPPLEAMAAGCPVAVARSSSLPEVCGDAAVYFDPENHYDLIDSVKGLLLFDEKTRVEQRAKGRARVAIYSQRQQKRQWIEVCRWLGL